MKFFGVALKTDHTTPGERYRRRLITLLAVTVAGCGQSVSTKIDDRHATMQDGSNVTAVIADKNIVEQSPKREVRETTLSVKEMWRIERLGAPVGIAYDPETQEVLLAQIGGEGDAKDGDGVISRVSTSGQMLEFSWAKRMNAPKDLVIDQGSIWVTDIDAIIEFDRRSGDIRQTIPVPDAKFLVGIAIDSNHRLLLADLLASRVSSFKDGEFQVLYEGADLQSPSKLFCAEDGIIIASWGFTNDFTGNEMGSLFTRKPGSVDTREWSVPMTGHWMGLCPDRGDAWFLSDFETGIILRLAKNGSCEKIAELGRGLGGILYVPELQLLLAAHVTDNRLIAFQLSERVASCQENDLMKLGSFIREK